MAYSPAELRQYHETNLENGRVEWIDIPEFELPRIPYYLNDFEGQDCDWLVMVSASDDPAEGTPPLIQVSSRIPEALRPYAALHEYIEFDIAQLEGVTDPNTNKPWTCAAIEDLVLSLVPDEERETYIKGRIWMFNALQKMDVLNQEMAATRQMLSEVLREEYPLPVVNTGE